MAASDSPSGSRCCEIPYNPHFFTAKKPRETGAGGTSPDFLEDIPYLALDIEKLCCDSMATFSSSGKEGAQACLEDIEGDRMTVLPEASSAGNVYQRKKDRPSPDGDEGRLLEDLFMAETEVEVFEAFAAAFANDPAVSFVEPVIDRVARRFRSRRTLGESPLHRRSLVSDAYRSGIVQHLGVSDASLHSFVESRQFETHPDLSILVACPIVQTGGDPLAILLLGGREPVTFEDPRRRNLLRRISSWGEIALARIRKKAELEEMSLHDPLTGLLNRHGLFVAFRTFAGLLRRRGTEGLLCILDLDDFKRVNDSWGHPAGDALLEEVGSRLRKTLRESDLLGRLGGDEFVFVAESSDRASLPLLMSRVSKAFARPFILPEGQEMPLALSAGLLFFSPKTPRLDDLLREADRALYDAKRNKGTRETFFVLCEMPSGGKR